jgi:hypothetical protein
VVDEAGVGMRSLRRGRGVRSARLGLRLGPLALAPVYALYTRCSRCIPHTAGRSYSGRDRLLGKPVPAP